MFGHLLLQKYVAKMNISTSSTESKDPDASSSTFAKAVGTGCHGLCDPGSVSFQLRAAIDRVLVEAHGSCRQLPAT